MSRRRRRGILIALAIAISPGLLAADPPPETPRRSAAFYEIVYADANIGASSGGHSALKFGDTVYHYQMYQDGVFRLVREDWSEFRRLYNDRENRSLGIRRVRLPERKLRAMQDFFALRFLVQLRHLDFFTALQHEREFWQALVATRRNPRVPVPGYGMFETESGTDARDGAAALREHIAVGSGASLATLLRSRRTAIEARLRRTLAADLRAGAARLAADADLAPELALAFDPDRLPAHPALFSQSVREGLAELAALEILERAPPLKARVLFDPFGDEPPAVRALKPFERSALEQYRAQIAREILGLLRTPASLPGPDRGATLLLNQARHRAISVSLSENRLRTLDPFPARRTRVTVGAIQKDRTLVHALAARARSIALRTRAFALETDGGLTERRYNRLESDAGRYFEINRGVTEPGYSIRTAPSPMIPGTAFARGFAVPSGALGIEWAAFRDAGGAVSRLERARRREARYLQHLRRGYDYHLIRKNCVTELLRSIEASGGVPESLDLEHPLRFIPFVAFDLFAPQEPAQNDTRRRLAEDDRDSSRESAVATDLRWLPSFRKRRLAKILRREGPIAAPRESFAAHSTIYTPRPGDTAFLLFTDDIFWARPLYGAANLLYGAGAAGFGVFSAPFDRGERLKAGLRGALFSLPELAWFNIRKGSYDLSVTVDSPPAP
ncbi:MAG: hypothetical protein RIF32_21945 [Leptospirales bacterium]